MPMLQFFVSDHVADTHHLSLEDQGCYVMIMFLTWLNKCRPFPDDDTTIPRMLHITKKKWKKIKPKLTPFFNLEENTFRQMRLEKTWETAEERVKKSKEAADIRWAKEKESVQSIISKTAKAMREH